MCENHQYCLLWALLWRSTFSVLHGAVNNRFMNRRNMKGSGGMKYLLWNTGGGSPKLFPLKAVLRYFWGECVKEREACSVRYGLRPIWMQSRSFAPQAVLQYFRWRAQIKKQGLFVWSRKKVISGKYYEAWGRSLLEREIRGISGQSLESHWDSYVLPVVSGNQWYEAWQTSYQKRRENEEEHS